MKRQFNRRLIVTFVFLTVGCATGLVQPTEMDLKWAAKRWEDISMEELLQGRNLYIKRCAGCHHLYLPDKYPPEQWPEIVSGMEERARINSHEKKLIIKYLSSISARFRSNSRDNF